MSLYTTGEMAKLCGVSVRTVQYYDTRGILCPNQLSEGGRRLYTEEDAHRLQVICFLRGLGLPINSIGELLAEEEPGRVITLLLEQQAEVLRQEIGERQQQLTTIESLAEEVAHEERLTVEALHDIAYRMKNKRDLRRVRGILFAVGMGMDIIELSTLILWILTGIWWPFAVGMLVFIIMGVTVSRFYYLHTAYLCPACHRIFRPAMREVFWARHTPRTRKLTCTHCGYKGFCVETYWKSTQ